MDLIHKYFNQPHNVAVALGREEGLAAAVPRYKPTLDFLQQTGFPQRSGPLGHQTNNFDSIKLARGLVLAFLAHAANEK